MDHATCFRTPPGNALCHLLVPADRSLDPGDHRDRSPHRPIPQGRADSPSLPSVRDPVARSASRTGPDHRRMDVQSHRAARPAGHAQPDVFPGSLVSPPFQDPQPHRLPPSLARSPSGAISTNRSTASSRRSFPWRSAWGWKPVWPRRPWPSASAKRRSRPPRIASWQYLKRDHGVSWSVATLRKVIAGVSEGMEPHRHDASVAQVLKWLEQAHASRGGRKPVLAVGRDGLMLPIRGEACYREGATATVSVHDRRGRRLGTVYLGRMPEPGQETLSRQLTALIEDVLRQWNGPLPRLAYITDGGNHQTQYFRRVLKRMRHPRCPGQRLKWEWVIDYYHACEYIYKLAEALFSDAKRAQGWARKMCRWLKKKPRGIYRVLHSAAAIRRRRIVVGEKRKQYHKAYDYLRKRIRFLDYCEYRRNHLPIGSGVTEAACKTVFTQRLKQSGMTWSLEGGQWIVDLRVIHLSGIWPQVYQAYLQAKILPEMGTQEGSRKKKPRKAA